MSNRLVLSLGIHYLRAHTRNRFISFIGAAASIGIALGVMVLITVLSVMNGFSHEVKQHLFNVAQHVTIYKAQPPFTEAQANTIQQQIAKHPGILASAPFILGQAMISHQGGVAPLLLFGIDPAQECELSPLTTAMQTGKLAQLKPNQFNIVVGNGLSNKLNLLPSDKLTVVTPKADHSIVGILPRFKRFKLTGIFSLTDSKTLNSQSAFIHWQDAQALLKLPHQVTGLRLKIDDMDQAPKIAFELQQQLGPHYIVQNWTAQFADFFRALQLEKTMMFMVLLLIILIAAFNLITGLVMLVVDKQQDIAILRTLGLTPTRIMGVFITQGTAVGLIGIFFGVLAGVLLSLNITPIVAKLESLLHTQLMPSSVYLINYLPAELDWHDIVMVVSIALLISLLATLYPAYRAAKIQPAKVLRYA